MKVLYPNKQDFEELVKKEGVVLVDFFASWCEPCKKLSPIIDQIKERYNDKVTVIKVDIDEETELAKEYDIIAIPTLLIFKNGELMLQKSSFMSFEKISSILDNQLYNTVIETRWQKWKKAITKFFH